MPKRILRDGEEEYTITEYDSSNTELALEELCASFGTELEPAYLETINHLLLVRLSRPIIIPSERLGRQLLQFQYTKFSMLDILQQTLKPILDRLGVSEEEQPSYARRHLFKDFEEKGNKQENLEVLAKAVIDCGEAGGIRFHRFPKEVYVAAFPAVRDETRKPFTIHEAGTHQYSRKPSFFVRFERKPVLYSDHFGEVKEEKDSLYISWPSLEEQASHNLQRAASVVAKGFSLKHTMHFAEALEIPEKTPVETTLSFVRSFIKQSLYETVY